MRPVLALLVLASATAAAARPGRNVRVERTHGRGAQPRVCQMSPSSGQGTCFGKPPFVGERVRVISGDGNTELAIQAVEPVLDSCQNVATWRITLDRIVDIGGGLGYIDVPLDLPRAANVDTGNLRSPGDRDGEQVLAALDRNGDGTPDFETVAYTCDASGELSTVQSAGYCLDYWMQEITRWRLVRHDFVRSCL